MRPEAPFRIVSTSSELAMTWVASARKCALRCESSAMERAACSFTSATRSSDLLFSSALRRCSCTSARTLLRRMFGTTGERM